MHFDVFLDHMHAGDHACRGQAMRDHACRGHMHAGACRGQAMRDELLAIELNRKIA